MSPGELLGQVRHAAPAWAEDHIVHAIVVFIVVVAASILRGVNRLDNNTVSIVFGTAIGYAAGRSGAQRVYRSRPQGGSDGA